MPKKQIIQKKAAGLNTQYDPLSGVPEGALLEATNCMINREGVISKRFGFDEYEFGSNQIAAISEYKDELVGIDSAGTIRHGSDNLTGTFTKPGSYRMRFAEGRQNLYFCTDEGIKVYDNNDSETVRAAGMPQGLVGFGALHAVAPTWFEGDTQVAYRFVLRKTDENGREVRGAPSYRWVITNDSGDPDAHIDLELYLPAGVVAGDVIEIYRTDERASPTANDDPGPVFFYVGEVEITSGHITAQKATFADEYSYDYFGVPLYTNPAENTIAEANDLPPAAEDIAFFRGHLFASNTAQPEYKEFTINTIANFDSSTWTSTFTIEVSGDTSYTYTGSAAEDDEQREFLLKPTNSGANIRQTCLSLCRVINQDPGQSAVQAYYVSGYEETPGKVLLRSTAVESGAQGTPDFYLRASADVGADFTPALPAAGTTVGSDKDYNVNRLHRSRFEQPEAFPALKYDDIGNDDSPILRILPLRDSLIILKEEGIWRLSGDSDFDFRVDQLDPTTRCIAPDTAVVLNNAVYFLSNQGVVRVTENGTSIVSRSIEPDIDALTDFTNFDTISFGVAHERRRMYMLWCQSVSADNDCHQAFIYDYLTRQWTKWGDLEVIAGHVLFDNDKLYLADAAPIPSDLYEEQKALTSEDYFDFSDTLNAVNITSVGSVTDTWGNTVTQVVTDAMPLANTFKEGVVFEQASDVGRAMAYEQDGADYKFTLDDLYPSMTASSNMTVYGPIHSRVRWAPEDAKNPAQVKLFLEGQIYLEDDGASQHHLGFYSDEDTTEESVIIQIDPVRSYVPRQHQRCRALSVIYEHKIGKETFDILSMALTYRPVGERTVHQR